VDPSNLRVTGIHASNVVIQIWALFEQHTIFSVDKNITRRHWDCIIRIDIVYKFAALCVIKLIRPIWIPAKNASEFRKTAVIGKTEDIVLEWEDEFRWRCVILYSINYQYLLVC
jgi:hypothetical protein